MEEMAIFSRNSNCDYCFICPMGFVIRGRYVHSNSRSPLSLRMA